MGALTPFNVGNADGIAGKAVGSAATFEALAIAVFVSALAEGLEFPLVFAAAAAVV